MSGDPEISRATPLPLHKWSSTFGLAGSWVPLRPKDSKKSRSRLQMQPQVSPTTLRVVTWNVWFDAKLLDLRSRELVKILAKTDPDVICLQETTATFQRIIAENPVARSKWIMTNLKDEQNVTGSSYGTMIIIRKALISEMGWHASISFTLFDETQCGRGLGILKLDTPESKQSIIVSNSHFELDTTIRATQFRQTRSILDRISEVVPRLTIICGDTNIFRYSELTSNFLKIPEVNADSSASVSSTQGFIDTLLAANPIPPNLLRVLPEEEMMFRMPTYGNAGLTWDGKARKERVARLDYILARPFLLPILAEDGEGATEPQYQKGTFAVKSGRVLGDTPISDTIIKMEAHVDDPQMKMWPSDHLGVCVDMEVDL